MGTKSPGGPQRCRIMLQHCLAIQLTKPGHTPEDFWMYDSGYMIFQNFLAANSQCWWNAPLTAATRALRYAGHIAPGMLLVTAEPCALEVLRGAYARSVLKPPATYIIHSVGDIDDCIVTPTMQGQFTPLTEALCDVIMDLTSVGQSATIENIKVKLAIRFPHMQQPSVEMIYDTLAQLMQEGKIYQTSKGYFIVTPERRRSRSRPKINRSFDEHYENGLNEPQEIRTMLMSNSEALHSLYGEISTERDGDLTHQCIQTNLADVICGGNPNDKILYPRNAKRRSASFPTPRSLERRHSLRLFGSSKRLQRCASTRSLSKNYAQTLLGTDSSSSEYHSTDSTSSPKKGSLLSRLFRRSGRSKQRQLETYSAQFPPAEWFNSRAVHLHSVGTQTIDRVRIELPPIHTLSNSTFYDGSEISQRSSTLPRRHHRRHLSSESTFLISSRDCSPIRRRSPAYSSVSLPRSTHSIPGGPLKTTPIHHQKLNGGKQVTEPNKNEDVYRSSPTRHTGTLSRSVHSGPSSLESGKASIITSGPSSIDSGKMSFSRTSGHSSLESHFSTNTVQSPQRTMTTSIQSPKRQSQSSKAKLGSDYSFNKPPSGSQSQSSSSSSPLQQIPNSNSNSSITLQVTTNSSPGHHHHNQHNLPSTKIFVQNSPVRSVITLENGKLSENSNVFIINNETTTNKNGDLIKRTISKQNSMPTTRSTLSSNNRQHDHDKENYFSENDVASETGDSISMISEISPDSSLTAVVGNGSGNGLSSMGDSVESPAKFIKNINREVNEMNNSRKLTIQMPNHTNGTSASVCNGGGVGGVGGGNGVVNGGGNAVGGNIIYKNVFRNPTSNPTSPINNKNIQLFESQQQQQQTNHQNLMGSVGNLRCFDKNMTTSVQNNHHNNHNHNHHHQLHQLNETTKLNSNPAINSDSLAHILQKSIITSVGSEPNLAINKNISEQQKIIDKTSLEGNTDKNRTTTDHRRFSLTKSDNQNQLMLQQNQLNQQQNDNVYSFPSLTDLSFNFTSLAAQKILQGVSINSLDTLVELNMANGVGGGGGGGVGGGGGGVVNGVVGNQEKQQNNSVGTICTDYGLV